MIAELTKTIVNLNEGIKHAKPNRDLVFKFSKGELNISGSTMDFLMYLSPYIDLNGRVNIPLEKVRHELCMQTNTYRLVLLESLVNRLLVKKGDQYFSRFHIHVNGTEGKLNYIKLLKVFTSQTLRNYTLREKRLFYYFASAGRIDNWHRVRIENLYDNKIGNIKNGVKYFNTCREVTNALINLVYDGLIEIQLKDQDKNSFYNINKNTANFSEILYTYLSFSDGKKKRTSKYLSHSHVLNVRIHPDLLKEEVNVIASETEFIQLAESNNIAWDKLNPRTTSYFFNYKNELFSLVGELGLKIYSHALKNYLEENSGSVIHYDRFGKAANYFMDYYLIKEINSILSISAYHQKKMAGRLNYSTKMYCGKYYLDFKQVESLFIYFLKKSSKDQKILLENFLFQNEISHQELVHNHNNWMNLKDLVRIEYDSIRDKLSQQTATHNPLYLDFVDLRDFMVINAERGLASRKKELEALVSNLKENLSTLAPRFNWLEYLDKYYTEHDN